MVTIKAAGGKFSHLKAVIFDKDGTLANSHNFLRELAYKRARLIDAQIPGIGEPLLMAFGIQDGTLDPTGLMAVGSHGENEIAAAAYIAETGRSWFESREIAHTAFTQARDYLPESAQNSSLFPGSLELLKRLAAVDLKIGILSADSTAGVKAFVQHHQLGDYINLCMGVEEQGPNKPDPLLFLQACQALAVEPQAALMIGDSAGDIEMAHQAGAAGTIGFCWQIPKATHLNKADVAIAQFDEIQIASE